MKKILLSILLLAPLLTIAQNQKASGRINHLAIFVVNLEKSTQFYQNILGLDTVPEPFHDGKHSWLRIGPGSTLHIIEGAPVKKEYYKNNHICFSVPSLEPFVELLKKNNLSWEDVAGKKNAVTTRVDGVKQLWLQDPDGYWVEVNDAKE